MPPRKPIKKKEEEGQFVLEDEIKLPVITKKSKLLF